MIGLVIDPGLSTGMCLFEWGDNLPFAVRQLWQFTGGAAGLAAALKAIKITVDNDGTIILADGEDEAEVLDALIVEKFTPRPHEGFSHTQASVEPLRGEGVLIGLGLEPFIQWREPSQQYFMGGDSLADKKKRSRRFLETFEIKPTGKDVEQPDADDAISATLHAIAWLRHKKHMPTLLHYFAPKGI